MIRLAIWDRRMSTTSQLMGGGSKILFVEPGRIPARGTELLRLALEVEVDQLAADLGSLLSDAASGAVAFDAETRMPGRVTLLGFIKHHAVATSNCHVVIGVPDLSVRSQECDLKTKL